MPPSNDEMGALQRSRHNRLKLALIAQFHSEDFDFCCDGCAAVIISEITSGVLTSLCHVPFYCLIHVKKSALLFLCWTATPAKLTSEALTFSPFILDVVFFCPLQLPVEPPWWSTTTSANWGEKNILEICVCQIEIQYSRFSLNRSRWLLASWDLPVRNSLGGGLCEMQGWRKTVGFKLLHPLLHRNDGSASSGYLPTVPINWICTENTFP